MTGNTRIAMLFIMIVGLIFILTGILSSLIFNLPSVFAVGMGIVGIFLIFLPFTRDRYQQ